MVSMNKWFPGNIQEQMSRNKCTGTNMVYGRLKQMGFKNRIDLHTNLDSNYILFYSNDKLTCFDLCQY